MGTDFNHNVDSQSQQIGYLYECYGQELKLYFLSYTHNMMEAEDLLHDLFLRLYHVEAIDQKTAKHFLLCVAHHLVLDDRRHRQYTANVLHQYKTNRKEAFTSNIINELDNQIFSNIEKEQVDKMPAKRRQIYLSWRSDAYTFQEISVMFNISRRTAEAHVYHAVRDLKETFKNVI